MKMKLKSGQAVKPRTGETHGLFGVRYVKHHNMRDVDWTAKELVTQYEKISNIYSNDVHISNNDSFYSIQFNL